MGDKELEGGGSSRARSVWVGAPPTGVRDLGKVQNETPFNSPCPCVLGTSPRAPFPPCRPLAGLS